MDEFCRAGGWPPLDGDDFEFSVTQIKDYGHEIKVAVDCYFKEQIQTGCSDCPVTESAQGEIFLLLCIDESKVYLISESEWDDSTEDVELPF